MLRELNRWVTELDQLRAKGRLQEDWPEYLGPEFDAYSTPGRLGPIG